MVVEQAPPDTVDGGERLVLVLPDGRRVPVVGPMTIGRGADAAVQIADQTVSRTHARVIPGPDGPLIADAGSRFGTKLGESTLTEPAPLRPGVQIHLGDVVIKVESAARRIKAAPSGQPPDELPAAPGETLVVPVNATQLGLRSAPPAESGGDSAMLHPRIRSGWALKRLGADEGDARFVLQDLREGSFLRLDAADAALLELLDGTRTVAELLTQAKQLGGAGAAARLTRLLAELADRGLLNGVAPTTAPERQTFLQRVFKPRARSLGWVSDYFPRAYHRWGRVFFSPLSATFLALFALAGFAGFTYLIGSRYGTPFVVANRLIIGGAVFIAGRFALVACHELAHGLALAHYHRRARRGGLRLVLIFPYAFIDTSEAYFEPRWNRIKISAAGPACDLTLGALFVFACAATPRGSLGDVFFQLALGGYIGAFFNLNPFLDRDGYTILVDYLREPGLRQRARQQLASRLSGSLRPEQGSPVLARYAIAGVIWSAVGAVFAILFSNRYYDILIKKASHGLVLGVFITFYVILFIPVLVQLGLPLLRRARFGAPEANRVIG